MGQGFEGHGQGPASLGIHSFFLGSPTKESQKHGLKTKEKSHPCPKKKHFSAFGVSWFSSSKRIFAGRAQVIGDIHCPEVGGGQMSLQALPGASLNCCTAQRSQRLKPKAAVGQHRGAVAGYCLADLLPPLQTRAEQQPAGSNGEGAGSHFFLARKQAMPLFFLHPPCPAGPLCTTLSSRKRTTATPSTQSWGDTELSKAGN